MPHPIKCRRSGFTCHITDGVHVMALRAESAPEARRFAEAVTWLANVHPEWTLGEVVQTAYLNHEAAFRAQAKRRFKTCFGSAA